MERTTVMDRMHPGVSLLFFVCAVGGTLLLEHPLFRACALCGALCCHAVLCPGAGRFLWRTATPVCALAAGLNPLFNHRGIHILFYFPWGNPCTAESLLFGLYSAGLLLCILVWFRCYTTVMTSEKSLFLFSRFAPSLTLLLRLSLRFLPAFRLSLNRTRDAQTALLGPPSTKKEALHRAFSAVQIHLKDALQDAVSIADAMKSRGYGLPGRTCFAAFRFHNRDKAALTALLVCALPPLGACGAGLTRFSFFPLPNGAPLSPLTVFCALAFFALCLFPVFLHGREVSRWNYCKSTA